MGQLPLGKKKELLELLRLEQLDECRHRESDPGLVDGNDQFYH